MDRVTRPARHHRRPAGRTPPPLPRPDAPRPPAPAGGLLTVQVLAFCHTGIRPLTIHVAPGFGAT